MTADVNDFLSLDCMSAVMIHDLGGEEQPGILMLVPLISD